ncbi:AAA family ATPase [Rhodococcus olei]|uniref:bifunctional aminoglycoside phosphotransferase/ATP-binding protein n=1 Tax=Rhodococcus olei TaxID=2161675 RepID=UPI0031E9EC00
MDNLIVEPSATVRETHTAYVVMVGDVVFKAKKPVRTAFLDFGTAERRRSACRREVELNRRLCPDVYLGVAELTDPHGGPAEPLVKMRRMPDDRRLAAMIAGGEDVAGELAAIARILARFHRGCRRGRDIDRDATRDAVVARWRDNLAEAQGYGDDILPGATVAEIGRRAHEYLAGRAELFAERIDQRRIVDGHGDLLADDIFCLPDGPRILDCLDFDDHLRHVDVIDDVACLAMDLDHLGRADLAAHLLARFRVESGDDPPPSLVHHYVAYRAVVRAKVAALRHEQGATDARTEARRHADLAVRHLRTGSVRLGLVGGLPGTGKSTLARALAGRTGAVVLASDRVRKQLAGLDPRTPCPAEYGRGLYTGAMTDRTYSELLVRATALLSLGRSVVLDASWTDPRHRAWALSAADRTHSELIELECTAPRSVALERIERRAAGESDADSAVYDAVVARYRRRSSATVVDTTADPGVAIDAALTAWGAIEIWGAAEPGPDDSVPEVDVTAAVREVHSD